MWAALIPSQVEAILMRTRDLSMPSSLYNCTCVSEVCGGFSMALTNVDDVKRLANSCVGVE